MMNMMLLFPVLSKTACPVKKHPAVSQNTLFSVKTPCPQSKHCLQSKHPALGSNTLPSVRTPCPQAKHPALGQNTLPSVSLESPSLCQNIHQRKYKKYFFINAKTPWSWQNTLPSCKHPLTQQTPFHRQKKFFF